MNSTSFNFVYICILITLWGTASRGQNTQIWPSGEIQINEGQELEITCVSDKKVHFHYPKYTQNRRSSAFTTLKNKATTSPAGELFSVTEDGNHKATLRRASSNFGDTGWYTCINENVPIPSNVHEHPNGSSVYVYVKSHNNQFADPDVVSTIHALVGNSVTFPCRPTSPDLHVELISDGSSNFGNNRVTFDPKKGFRMNHVLDNDSGSYECRIKTFNGPASRFFNLIVHEVYVPPAPQITVDNGKYAFLGSKLRLRCNVKVDRNHESITFRWTTPVSSSKNFSETYINYDVHPNMTTRIFENVLTIDNATHEDTGLYVCTVQSFKANNSASMSIKLRDPAVHFLHVNYDNGSRLYERNLMEFVEWTIHIVDAHPEPKIIWKGPNGSLLQFLALKSSYRYSKFTTKNIHDRKIFRINNLREIDSGIYTLEVSNSKTITIPFVLSVHDSPSIQINEHKKYFARGEKLAITCSAQSSPPPNISWSFLMTPYYPSLRNSSSFDLEASMEVREKNAAYKDFLPVRLNSKLEMTTDVSGILACKSCNEFGCNIKNTTIFISDIGDDFGIIKPSNPITHGGDVTVICAASVHNYKSVEWLDEKENQVTRSDKLHVTYKTTPFTHRAELHINNVQKMDETNYSCVANSLTNVSKSTTYRLIVSDYQSRKSSST